MDNRGGRRLWLGSGWKMNKLLRDADDYLSEITTFLDTTEPRDLPNLFLVPPFTLLREVCRRVQGYPILVGAQNTHWERQGAYTGEVSPAMIKDCGAHLVEIGHSERRAYFAETDCMVNKKVLAVLTQGLKPLVCIGENAVEKNMAISSEVVAVQIKIALNGVPLELLTNIIVAYEPVWAIGEGGVSAEPEYASYMHTVIRDQIAHLSTPKIAESVPILYGGSVTQDNAISFLKHRQVDGLFVGRATWNVEGLRELIKLITVFQQN